MSRPSRARAHWALYVDIFEPAGAGVGYPVVRHVFYGKTKGEAEGYFKSHMGTDTFLKGCVDRGRFETFDCIAEWRWRRMRR